MPSLENGCFYIHNIFLSFWKERPMVWESSVPAALCSRHPPLHRLFQWFSLVQRLWFIKPHVLTLPPDPDLGWPMFHKVISSRTRVCHVPRTQWAILPSPEGCLG